MVKRVKGVKELLLSLLIAVAAVSCAPQAAFSAQGAALDLKEWSPTKDGTVVLAGEWDFYWNSLLTPQDLGRESTPPPRRVHLPDFWNTTEVGATQAGRFGAATYRLEVSHARDLPELALKIPIVFTTYRLWIDGVEQQGRGRPGTSRDTSVPQAYSNTVFFTPVLDKTEILLQVSNYHDMWGGPRYPIVWGTRAQIEREDRFSLVFITVLVGAILMGAIYHLGLFFSRALERSTLFFGLLCLAVAFNTLLSGEVFFLHAFPDLPWELQNKFEWLTLHLGFLFCVLYFYNSFQEEMSRRIVRIITIVDLLLSANVLVFEAQYYTLWGLNAFEGLVITASGYLFWAMFKAVRARRTGSVVSMIGFVVFFLTIVNHILSNNDFVTITTSYLLSLGLFIFILFQSFVISLKFAHAQRKVDQLSRELLQYSNELEVKVQERTKELEDAHSQKIDFFVNIAHETRTPLTLIHNYLEALLRKTGVSKELAIIRDNFQKLQRDMVNYLDLEKLNRGQFFYDNNQAADLGKTAADLVELFKETAVKRSIRIEFEPPPATLVALIDPSALERILTNLLDNAVKYAHESSVIVVKVWETDTQAHFSVKNEGLGIPESQIPGIFLPYHQLSHKKRNIQGIGMGLAIVKKILEGAGGSISVSSKENEGAEFDVCLARAHPESMSAIRTPHPSGLRSMPGLTEVLVKPEASPLAATTAGADSPLLLVVEDNDPLRSFLCENLNSDYRTVPARNGLEALKLLDLGTRPALILSDVMMDEMGGVELLEKVRERPVLNGIPFLFLTARATLEDRIRNLEKGAVDTISKPFGLEELRAKIGALLEFTKSSWAAGLEEAARLITDRIVSGPQTMSAPEVKPAAPTFDDKCREYEITDRQKEIIRLISKGYEYKEIGGILHISTHTVDRHVQNLYEKTGKHNRIDLLNLFFAEQS